MAEHSKIDWLAEQPEQNIGKGDTVNLWWGCSKVHTGCKHCYAESLSNRYGNDIWGENKLRKRIKSAFNDLERYQRQAAKANKLVKVFIGSMMDIFEEPKIITPNPYLDTKLLRDALFWEITDGSYPNIIFLFLTKRPENIPDYIPWEWLAHPPHNVWMGTSISDTKTKGYANTLRKNFLGNKFLSIEPQVEYIVELNLDEIGWVIQGGESGPRKRPFDIKWAERMKGICEEQNVPYFFKQIDKVQPIPEHLMVREYPDFKQKAQVLT